MSAYRPNAVIVLDMDGSVSPTFGDSVPFEVVGDEINERQVRIAVGGVESDQPAQHLDRREDLPRHDVSFPLADSGAAVRG